MENIRLSIHNPSLAKIVLGELIETIETRAGLDALLHQGCAPELIDLVRRRPTRDLNAIADRMTMEVVLDAGQIVQSLKRLDFIRQTDELCEYFVRNGASKQMVARLFKKTEADVRRLRETLLGVQSTTGRTSLPQSDAERDAIHAAWNQICTEHKDEGLRDHLWRLHQQYPAHAIESLWLCVNEFENEQHESRSRKAA